MSDQLEKKMEPELEQSSSGDKPTGEIRKIVVDRAACIGARSCVLVAGNTFAMDDDNLAYVRKETAEFEDDETIKLAAQSCPVLAIHLYNQVGKKIFPEAPG